MSSSANEAPEAKVSLKWKKRVKIEYARLRQQKKFRHNDDMRTAWRNNKERKEDDLTSTLQSDVKPSPLKTAKPVWICSEDPPSHSQFIRRAEAKDNDGKIQSIPIKVNSHSRCFNFIKIVSFKSVLDYQCSESNSNHVFVGAPAAKLHGRG